MKRWFGVASARRVSSGTVLAVVCGAVLAPAPAHAQLRPVQPLPWSVFDADRTLSVELGAGLLLDQTAALAGTVGRLGEIGNYQVAWRQGRIALEAEGTVLRTFSDESRNAAPDPGVRTAGPDRSDSGDHSVSTIVRLTPDYPSFATLRFGVRLPNSDNRIGLDRDRTDFFATLGGQLRRGAYRAAAEAGLGIFGTRLPDYEQSDVLVYDATIRHEGAHLSVIGSVAGHWTPHMIVRGNQNLAETRIGFDVGRHSWLRVLWVHGLAEVSPSNGFLISASVLH